MKFEVPLSSIHFGEAHAKMALWPLEASVILYSICQHGSTSYSLQKKALISLPKVPMACLSLLLQVAVKFRYITEHVQKS